MADQYDEQVEQMKTDDNDARIAQLIAMIKTLSANVKSNTQRLDASPY